MIYQRLLRTFLLATVLGPSLPAAYLSVYLSAPGEQQTFVSNAIVETFNSATVGKYTSNFLSNIGTYGLTGTSAFVLQAADQFGGASKSNYMTFGAQSGTSGAFRLDTTQDYNYFGFWWSAGDGKNAITLAQSGTTVASFTTADIINFLKTPTVTAVNGSTYNSSSYYGNPNGTNQNTGEPYAFISIVFSGAAYNQITFSNSNSTSTGFESDNHTVYFGNINVPGTAVFVKDIAAVNTSGTASAVPEPGTFALLFAGLMATTFALRQKASRISTSRASNSKQ